MSQGVYETRIVTYVPASANPPTAEQAGWVAVVGDDLVRRLTEAMRVADRNFEKVGGSTRHHVRDCLIPELEKMGLAVVALPAPAAAKGAEVKEELVIEGEVRFGNWRCYVSGDLLRVVEHILDKKTLYFTKDGELFAEPAIVPPAVLAWLIRPLLAKAWNECAATVETMPAVHAAMLAANQYEETSDDDR